MLTSDKACLLRRTESGEKNLLLVFFLRENGLSYVLARRSRRKESAPPLPDLFTVGDLLLERKQASEGPGFLKEFSPQAEFKGIGRDYKALRAASDLARFYEQNLLHMEQFPQAWSLLLDSLDALSRKGRPDVTILKSYFLFARSEGYPVLAGWIRTKPPEEERALAQTLRNPVESATASEEQVSRWLRDLNSFFLRETDLRPFS